MSCKIPKIDKIGWNENTEAAFNKYAVRLGRKKGEPPRGSVGIWCTKLAEGLPVYRKAPCEEVIAKGNNNAWIVVGRDRPGDYTTGYGGEGNTHCGMISLVAGRLGQNATDSFTEGPSKGKQIYADPNQRTDAAFIYISQKTDVDKNLALVPGSVGSPTAQSAIAIKADNLRMVARGGIKLVTGTDNKYSTDSSLKKGGQSCDAKDDYGIDLIGGNDENPLQPMVKGKNLIECLGDLRKYMAKLNGAIVGFIQYQLEFNTASLFHFHTVTVPLEPTFPPVLTAGCPLGQKGLGIISKQTTRSLRSLANHRYNLRKWEQKYLTPGHAKNKKTSHINSSYHHLN